MWLILFFLVITVIGLGRSALIVFGLYKDPILWSFQQYGPDERLPLPMATLLIWVGALVVVMGFWVSTYFPIPIPLVREDVRVEPHAKRFDTASPWKEHTEPVEISIRRRIERGGHGERGHAQRRQALTELRRVRLNERGGGRPGGRDDRRD